MTPILELQDLSFRYEGGLPGEKVLDALTFAVAPGERKDYPGYHRPYDCQWPEIYQQRH